MNTKRILSCFATISLLFFVVSCSNNDEKLGAENDTNNPTTTPQVEPTTSTPVAVAPNNPTTTPQVAPTTSTPVAADPNNPTTTPQVESTTSTPVAIDAPPSTTEVDLAKSASYTNEAKFLAGMEVDEESTLASQEKTPAWKAHAAFFDQTWGRLEEQQLTKIRKWSEQQLKPIYQSSKFIFYPFSGPDFLYGYTFFPQGNTYVLAGLEPVGSMPAIEQSSTSEIDRDLQRIEQSLGAILHLSFFRTNDMKVDLSKQGVLPILFVFLARTNNQILNMQYVELKKDATISALEKENKEKLISGVKIDFVPAGEFEPRSLYYFSADLSDSALKKTPEFNKFVQNLGGSITYLKAASYLLHYNDFSNIRNLILSQSISLLQDDSGIPIKYFNHSEWKLQFYGNYTQPIALFSNEYQKELKSIYQSKNNIKPLDFGIGYQYKLNDSNLMLATRKQ